MGLYYSPKTRGWYDTSFTQYILPEDSIKLTTEQWQTLRENLNSGKYLELINGNLEWIEKDESNLGLEARRTLERSWRDYELKVSDIELNKVQDSDSKAVGTVSQWREYRKALRAWPEHKNFPEESSRPVSPLVKE